MSADPATVGGPADLGKGLFGYRRSDVQLLIADRDLLLSEAERRMRTSEARVIELERALARAQDINAGAQEHLAKVQAQMDLLSARSAEVERVAVRVRAEAERVAAWRKRLLTVAISMAPSMERLRKLIDQIPERVQEAFTPVALNAPTVLSLMQAWTDAAARYEMEMSAR